MSMLPYQQTLVNVDALAAGVVNVDFNIRPIPGDVEDANSPEQWCVYYGAELGGAGSVDAVLKNLPGGQGLVPEHANGANIAPMTQLAVVGATGRDEFLLVEFVSARLRVTYTVVGGAPAAKLTVVLASNRPFSATPAT